MCVAVLENWPNTCSTPSRCVTFWKAFCAQRADQHLDILRLTRVTGIEGLFADRSAKVELEKKQQLRSSQLSQLQTEVNQAEAELRGLESEVEQLNSRAAQLENQAKEARALASNKAAYFRDYKSVILPVNLIHVRAG